MFLYLGKTAFGKLLAWRLPIFWEPGFPNFNFFGFPFRSLVLPVFAVRSISNYTRIISDVKSLVYSTFFLLFSTV